MEFEPSVLVGSQAGNLAQAPSVNSTDNNSLSVHNATWFLELLERANLDELPLEQQEAMIHSKLRVKPKHRTAILFQDDANFVLGGANLVSQDTAAFSQGNQANGVANFDHRVWLIREACKRVIHAYAISIENAPLRSCVWSALMHRAEFHLRRCGVPDVDIMESNNTNKEAMLCVQNHQVSRSNFTKIARQFIETASKAQKEQQLEQQQRQQR